MECLKYQGFISAKKDIYFHTFVGEKHTAPKDPNSQFKFAVKLLNGKETVGHLPCDIIIKIKITTMKQKPQPNHHTTLRKAFWYMCVGNIMMYR